MTIIDLSHTIKDGLRTYQGLPPVHICDFLSRDDSRHYYDEATEFQLDKIELVGNSGTYIDSPFHRYADGDDLSELALRSTINLTGIIIRIPATRDWCAIDRSFFEDKDVYGKAVLFDTGWSKYFGTEAYFSKHPFLTAGAAQTLRRAGAVLVGIDSHNIDDTRGRTRPVHSELLAHGIPIVEHLTNLNALPDQGFYFTAAPLKFKGVGTFPTRAYATMD